MLQDTLSIRNGWRAMSLGPPVPPTDGFRWWPLSATPADPDAGRRAPLSFLHTRHSCNGFRRAWSALHHDEGEQTAS